MYSSTARAVLSSDGGGISASNTGDAGEDRMTRSSDAPRFVDGAPALEVANSSEDRGLFRPGESVPPDPGLSIYFYV